MADYCMVLTTFESEEQADPIIGQVLQEKLAACVQVMNIRSHYEWNGQLCHDNEVLVLLKTRAALYEPLKQKLLELHPYETPEILKVDVADGSAGYLAWVDAMTHKTET